MATGSQSTSHTSITDLNEYCIIQLASHLTYKDKLCLIVACSSFGYLCSDIDLTILNACFELSASKQILAQCGPFVQKIKHIGNAPLSEPLYEILYQVVESCPNVQDLNITLVGCNKYAPTESSNKYFYHFRNLIAPLKQLQVLRLDDCGLSDINSEIISKFSDLESLDLSYNGMITGKFLSKLKKLTFLNLSHCTKIQSEHFIDICTSNKFNTLSIIGCDELNNGAIETLLETQTNLKMVLVSRIENADITKICQLKSLSILQIVGSEYIKSLTHTLHYNREFLDMLDFLVHEDNDILESIFEKITKIRNLKSLNFTEVQTFSNYFAECAMKRSEGIELEMPNFGKEYAAKVCEAMFPGMIVAVMEKEKPVNINEVEEFQRAFWERRNFFQAEIHKHFFKYVLTLSFDDNCTYTYYHNDFLSIYVYNCSDYIVIMKKLL